MTNDECPLTKEIQMTNAEQLQSGHISMLGHCFVTQHRAIGRARNQRDPPADATSSRPST
jgi:hypothetical protein